VNHYDILREIVEAAEKIETYSKSRASEAEGCTIADFPCRACLCYGMIRLVLYTDKHASPMEDSGRTHDRDW
jgi:hypothetical protein